MRLGYLIVYVPDVLGSVAFYERAFGLTRRFIDESGQFAEMETGATALAFTAEALAGSLIGAFHRNDPTREPAGVEVALVCDDVEAAYARALAAGARSVGAPSRQPWGQTVAHVRDRDGLLVELCSPLAV